MNSFINYRSGQLALITHFFTSPLSLYFSSSLPPSPSPPNLYFLTLLTSFTSPLSIHFPPLLSSLPPFPLLTSISPLYLDLLFLPPFPLLTSISPLNLNFPCLPPFLLLTSISPPYLHFPYLPPFCLQYMRTRMSLQSARLLQLGRLALPSHKFASLPDKLID